MSKLATSEQVLQLEAISQIVFVGRGFRRDIQRLDKQGLHRMRKKYFLSSRAKRGICFSARLPRNSRFLGQTPPFGMTWREFFRNLLSPRRPIEVAHRPFVRWLLLIYGWFSIWPSFPSTVYPQPLIRISPHVILDHSRKPLRILANIRGIVARADHLDFRLKT